MNEKQTYPDVKWGSISNLRNIAAHTLRGITYGQGLGDCHRRGS